MNKRSSILPVFFLQSRFARAALCRGAGALTAGAVALSPQIANAAWTTLTDTQGMQGDLKTIVTNVINWILGFAAVIAVLMLIWGGVQYLTAGGSPDNTKTAKSTIIHAIEGLVIIGLAYALVNTVVSTIGTSGGSGGENTDASADYEF
jgi:hypothetical protein